MREIGKALLMVIMWLAFAANVMLALFLFGRVLSGLVCRLRTRVGGAARANRPGGRANVISEPWTKRIVGVGRRARPRAQARGASLAAQAAPPLFEPTGEGITREAEGAGESAQTAALVIGTKYLLTLCFGVAISLWVVTAHPSAV